MFFSHQTAVKLVAPRLYRRFSTIWNAAYGKILFRQGGHWSRKQLVPLASPDCSRVVGPRSELEQYFDDHLEGPGIWKWRHYFPVYERHFQRFRGQAVRVLEIGIYSGGSLGMWVSYFGSRCQIIGVDIEPSCRVYETEQIQIEIGDQSDRNFWRSFRERIPPVDIIIDDGGHLPKQQRVTLEELLTHLNPGGVYLCEDITGTTNPYHAYLEGAARTLHSTNWSGDRILANAFQNRVASIHQYPFVCVIEVAQSPSVSFHTDRRGTQWQPFFRHQRAA